MTPEKRADIAERYAFAPGEREATERELAERQRQVERDDVLAWCHARNARAEAERRPDERTATKPEAAAMTDSMTDAWAQWINGQIRARRKASEATMSGAVADVLGGIEKKHQAALDDLRTKLTILRNEINQLRSEAKVRGTVDDLQARLTKLETAAERSAPGLRAVS